jgi:flagellar motor component MotA
MTREDFAAQYRTIAERAMSLNQLRRTEGILALEKALDPKKVNDRDIFEYGLSFVVDGIDRAIIDMFLSKLVAQEKDEDLRRLKTIQKEAVIALADRHDPRMLAALLNSHTDIPITDDPVVRQAGPHAWNVGAEEP